MNDIKKEFFDQTDFLLNEKLTIHSQKAIWSWIEQKLKDARIDENKYWLERFKGDYREGETKRRISELEEGK
jgi:hypothetical protein